MDYATYIEDSVFFLFRRKVLMRQSRVLNLTNQSAGKFGIFSFVDQTGDHPLRYITQLATDPPGDNLNAG